MKLVTPPEIPSEVELPGYTIKVRTARGEHLREVLGRDVYGIWIESKRLILINADHPTWEQLRAFYHELKHAVVDAEHYVRCRFVEPMEMEAAETAYELMEGE